MKKKNERKKMKEKNIIEKKKKKDDLTSGSNSTFLYQTNLFALVTCIVDIYEKI